MPSDDGQKEHFKNKVYFFVTGFLKQLVTTLSIIAASDILAGTVLPTTLAIVAHVGPFFVVTALLSRVIYRLPVLVRVILASILSALGISVYAFEQLDVELKLIGTGVAGVGVGITELCLLFWFENAEKDRSKFDASYELGGRISSLLGALYFTGLTSLACISSQTVLLTCAPLPLLNIPLYFVSDKARLGTTSQAATYKRVEYQPIGSEAESDESEKSWREQLLTTWKYTPTILSLFVGFLARYVAANAEATTLVFPESQVKPRDHFVLFTLSGIFGEMLGKCLKELIVFCTTMRKCVFNRTWDVAIFLVLASFVPLFASWYRFLPMIFVVLILMCTFGFLSGVVFSSAFFKLNELNTSTTKNFVFYLFNTAYSGGIVAGGFLGLYVEPILVKHCTELGRESEYCLARSVKTTISNSCLI